MNNDNRRDQKPDGSPVKLVIAVIVALLVLSDAVGIGGGTVLFIVLMIGAVVLAVIAMKKAQADAADKNSESDAAQPARTEPAKREFKPEHFDVSKFVGKGESISKRLTEKMRDDLTRSSSRTITAQMRKNAHPSSRSCCATASLRRTNTTYSCGNTV